MQGQKQNLFIIGSSGSIGTRTLSVVRNNSDKYNVSAISGHKNTELLLAQIKEFSPAFCVVTDTESGERLRDFVPSTTKLLIGQQHLQTIAAERSIDTIVAAAAGISSIEAVISALIARKKIALANKEVLVAAGSIIMNIAKGTGQTIIPIDSEHSAIFQCLAGCGEDTINKIILTCSGGAFRDRPIEALAEMRAEDALNHPTWSMGKKITVDSATMFNKGLEVIEAHWLFGVPQEKIEVVIHPSSIVHSLVEFADKNTLAVLSNPDMYLPISYALSYPKRLACSNPTLDLTKAPLEFFEPEYAKYPMFSLARAALKRGGLNTTVVNAANDAAVEKFLEGKIKFLGIYELVFEAFNKFNVSDTVTVENIKRVTKEVFDFVKRV